MQRNHLSWRFNLFSVHLFLFTLLLACNPLLISSKNWLTNPLADGICNLINCGQGTCELSSSSFYGFECVCNPGWKKMQIGPLLFPSCMLPNCSVDLQCGNGAPPPPPPPFGLPPPLNFSSPCNFVWCGDGNCVANGINHVCQCNEGSANLLNNTAWACFKKCYLGADCNNVFLGGSSSPPPPSTSSAPPGNGSTNEAMSRWTWSHLSEVMILVAAIFLALF